MPWNLSRSLMVASIAIPCLAQQFGMSGPISGFVFDEPTRSLRPIAGLPGAARLGEVLLQDIDWATVSPDGRVTLFRKDGEVRLLHLNGDGLDPHGVSVSGVIDSPSLSTWSRNSSAVGLYSSSANELQWIRFTGQGVISDPPLPLAGVDGKVIGLCGDRDSGFFFAAVAGKGVYQVSESNGTTMLLELPGVSAMALQTNGQTLWVADRAGARVIEIGNPGGDPEPRELIQDSEKLTDISAIAASADASVLYLADRATRRLHILERSLLNLSDGIELDVPATSFAILSRPSLLLLGQRNAIGDPLYVLELGANPAIYFVPAGADQ
jgi:hypothetical protein